jgi:pimeloyl-ACP methyl ester carboxylesterase
VRRFDIRVGDVLGDVPDVEQAVTLVVPGGDGGSPGVLLCAYPGGGYARGYYDIEWHGTTDYGQAEFHARRGWVVACVDHLGVGDSSTVGLSVGMVQLAAADAAVAAKLAAGLRDGSLVDGLGPVAIDTVIGLGQSMGGHLVTLAQANHRPFNCVAVLGSSAIHTVLPTPPAGADADAGFRYMFHGDEDDPEMVAADMDAFFHRSDPPPWASATIPSAGASLLAPGIQAEEAAAIDVPVLVGCGARDVVPDPWAEPSAYRASGDITLVVTKRMGHMHNFAPTRTELWRRLHDWSGT